MRRSTVRRGESRETRLQRTTSSRVLRALAQPNGNSDLFGLTNELDLYGLIWLFVLQRMLKLVGVPDGLAVDCNNHVAELFERNAPEDPIPGRRAAQAGG